VSIRLQLLIVALTTLVLPWAGWQYARELESALRGSQEQSLLASAGTIANALSAQPQRVFRNADARAFDSRSGDLYVHPLTSQPLLDGYREDWATPFDATILPTVSNYRARIQAGATERYLFLYLEVDDSHFDAEPNEVHPDKDRFDRVNLTLEGADGGIQSYFFGTTAPGLTAAQHLVKSEDASGETPDYIATESRIQAYWLQTPKGYNFEARLPLSFFGSRLWLSVQDGSSKGAAGFNANDDPEGGRLFFATGGLDELLATFVREGTRVTVIDTNLYKLGNTGTVLTHSGADNEDSTLNWYRRLMENDTSKLPAHTSEPNRLAGDSVQSALAGDARTQWVLDANARQLLMAAAPIVVEGKTRGAVVLEQGADQLLNLRDQALARLFNLTLIATATAVIVMFIFATWITFRIGRLRHAADSAVGNDGSIHLAMPESGSGDEIGALSRGFERLLGRLNEHALYLRALGGKLSHELRTPLTIVRSSLDNLESVDLTTHQQSYIARAREGTQRLQTILTSLGAAARVEESIKQAERVNFDLSELISALVAGYRVGFPHTTFATELPGGTCFMRGAPDLLAQMLDKLVENAVDFCPPVGVVTIGLQRESGNYHLAVQNDGPQIPPEIVSHLFESLYEQRQGRDDKPHFGLGLYIVRLIAEFHDGRVSAANRDDGGGAVFTVTLPML
jgi:two-component system, OmpR family, sensor histidine kinase ChvG